MNQPPFMIQTAVQPNGVILMSVSFAGAQHWTIPLSIEAMKEHMAECQAALVKAEFQRRLATDPRDGLVITG